MSSKKNRASKTSEEVKNKNNGSVSAPKKGAELVAVKFTQSYTPHVKGEIAGFEEETANELVEKGVAELV